MPPRVLSGGGIADGPINGVVNLYVIDDDARAPISGANVQVGTATGTTDATGLFTATGLDGAQTVLVQAAGYESAIWVAANGANITIDVKPTTDPTPPSANISGAVDLSGIVVGSIADHRTAVVVYSQDPAASDAVNNLATTNSANICDVTSATTTCDYTATVRTGQVALIAALYDHDLNGTPANPADDIFTLKGWAGLTGLTVAASVDQAGQNLAAVATTTESIAFGSPPGGLTTVEGIVGIELSDGSGWLQLPVAVPLATPMIVAPALSAYTNATYRVTALAENGATETSATSAQILHGLTGATLSVGNWLAPPVSVNMTRDGGTWTAVPGAVAESVSFSDASGNRLLAVTTFDNSSTLTIPALTALPAGGSITGSVQGLGGTIDPTNFEIDRDRDKLTGAAAQGFMITN